MTDSCEGAGYAPLILSSIDGVCTVVELPDGECLCAPICGLTGAEGGGSGGTGPTGPTGTTGSTGPTGPTGTTGPTGPTGTTGSSGPTTGVGYVYKTTRTGSGNPANGQVFVSHATTADINSIEINDESSAGNDLTTWLDQLRLVSATNKGVITLTSRYNPDEFASFTVTSVLQVGDYFSFAVTHLASTNTNIDTLFGDDASISVSQTRGGSDGSNGTNGSSGGGYTAMDINGVTLRTKFVSEAGVVGDYFDLGRVVGSDGRLMVLMVRMDLQEVATLLLILMVLLSG